MPTPELNPEQSDKESLEPQLQTEGAGSGGGRKSKTAIGTGDDGLGDDGNWFVPGKYNEPLRSREPSKHAQLKDEAINELSSTTTKEWDIVYSRLVARLSAYEPHAAIMAEALATMVVTAYTMAMYIPDQHVLGELRIVCAYFSDAQLTQIIQIAQKERR